MNRRQLTILATLATGVSSMSPVFAQIDMGKMGKMLDAGKDLSKSETLSDQELQSYFDQMSKEMDRKNKVAPAGNPYATRLSTLSSGLARYDGLNLNFKVYLTSQINAFAMANGTIRVYSGLLDKFTDDEVRYVVGHEIGHVKRGHTKARIQNALRTSALRNAVAATGSTAGTLASSQLGDLFEKVIVAQHSQGNEREADDYSMAFMKKNKYAPMACVTALDKLAAMSGGAGEPQWLSTHPSPQERSKRMRTQVA
jgi:metalloprotease